MMDSEPFQNATQTVSCLSGLNLEFPVWSSEL